jgi:aerotaxis receptor
MRNNQPVTNDEYVVPEGEVIITHTDPSSRITYANEAFLKSSGFTLEECLGEPQNIVRHPDMPPDAFADLWKTIRSGQAWSGIVKNRRKNGGFYWVRANVTPIMNRSEIVGYMSVRVGASREEIRNAEAAYAAVAARTGGYRVHRGRIIDLSLSARLSRLVHPSLSTGSWIVLGCLMTLFAGIALQGWLATSEPRLSILLMSALGLGVAASNLAYMQTRVVEPLHRFSATAMRILGGDTRCMFSEQGDPELSNVAATFNQMAIKLRGVLNDATTSAVRLLQVAEEVGQANVDLADRTNEHAASLEQTAASIEELTATVTRNTDNARQANQLAQDASSSTGRGQGTVSRVVTTISSMADASRQIADIVGIIDGIAFQTNLLALNAAVEAARAGEQGRGFAVVAQEVGSLAQRSAAAAKQVKDLIEASTETVAQGTTLAAQAQHAMQEVVSAVSRVTQVIAEIEAASREQAAGIEQINQAITQMDTITQQDAEMAENLKATAAVLQGQSQQVLTAISAFSLQLRASAASPAAGDSELSSSAAPVRRRHAA